MQGSVPSSWYGSLTDLTCLALGSNHNSTTSNEQLCGAVAAGLPCPEASGTMLGGCSGQGAGP